MRQITYPHPPILTLITIARMLGEQLQNKYSFPALHRLFPNTEITPGTCGKADKDKS